MHNVRISIFRDENPSISDIYLQLIHYSPSRSRDVSNQLLDLADLEGRELLHRGEILDHEGRDALEGQLNLSTITYNVP
jgi:hypothetical protein